MTEGLDQLREVMRGVVRAIRDADLPLARCRSVDADGSEQAVPEERKETEIHIALGLRGEMVVSMPWGDGPDVHQRPDAHFHIRVLQQELQPDRKTEQCTDLCGHPEEHERRRAGQRLDGLVQRIISPLKPYMRVTL